MSVTLVLPAALRPLADGRSSVTLDGTPATVGEAFGTLRGILPAVHDRLITERGELRPHINVFVGAESIRLTGGLETPLGDEAEVVILPAVSGG